MTQLRLVHRLLGLDSRGERHLLAHALRERVRAANAGVSRLRRARRGPIRRRRRLLLLPAALGALNLQARLHELLQTRDGVALVVALGGGGDVDGAGGVAGGGGARRGKRRIFAASALGWVFVLRFFPARGDAGVVSRRK